MLGGMFGEPTGDMIFSSMEHCELSDAAVKGLSDRQHDTTARDSRGESE